MIPGQEASRSIGDMSEAFPAIKGRRDYEIALAFRRRACRRDGICRRGPGGRSKIGVAGPLTGPNAAFGAQLQKGAEQAVDDINAAGGVLGRSIALEFGDDVSDPKQGVSVANKFVGDGVKFVDGHFNSGVSIPASEVYAENGILADHAGRDQPGLHRARPVEHLPHLRSRRPAGRGRRQVDRRQLKGKKVAVIHDKTPYGQGLADETKKALNAAGVTEVDV